MLLSTVVRSPRMNIDVADFVVQSGYTVMDLVLGNVISGSFLRKLLKVKLHNDISKRTRILFGVTFRNINYIRFQNNRPDLAVTVIKTVGGSNRTVVSQTVFAAGDTESGGTTFVIENVESFGASCRRRGVFRGKLWLCGGFRVTVKRVWM
ncbi:hypothetical protein KIW84_020506 [Lathyrus oleraceus]|uniref:Uncharacterized protein n=1 Tax=Pisum sativum TaxID=3888 RepID=A0A9D4YAT8_PEA|nr:hypothetical protein KIW84_020506 [Pisum sativum]